MIINVMAASVDGFVATHPDQSDSERHQQGFSSETDWQKLLSHIRNSDAVIVGSSTLKAGGGVVDQPREDGTWPIWVVLTNKGIPPDHIFWEQTQATRWLVSSEPLIFPEDANTTNVKNIVYHGTGKNGAAVSAVLKSLKEAGCSRVLLLGGGGINRMFYEAGAVDELILTVCPVLVARKEAIPLVQTGLNNLVHFDLYNVATEDNLVFLHYKVRR